MDGTEQLARRMHKGSPRSSRKDNICMVPHKTKSQIRKNFNLDRKIDLVHDILVGKMKLVDAAKKYQRSPGHISNIIKKVKCKP